MQKEIKKAHLAMRPKLLLCGSCRLIDLRNSLIETHVSQGNSVSIPFLCPTALKLDALRFNQMPHFIVFHPDFKKKIDR
jgi:hypothetical protein